jgi:hypothetical protein
MAITVGHNIHFSVLSYFFSDYAGSNDEKWTVIFPRIGKFE